MLSAKSLKEIAFSIAPSLNRLTCSQEQLPSMISAEDVTERRAMRAARASMCCFNNLALASFGRWLQRTAEKHITLMLRTKIINPPIGRFCPKVLWVWGTQPFAHHFFAGNASRIWRIFGNTWPDPWEVQVFCRLDFQMSNAHLTPVIVWSYTRLLLVAGSTGIING